MYIHMYSMAKTIMISNEVYDKLKNLKGSNSFSEALKSLINSKNIKNEGYKLRDCLGILKTDKEWKEIEGLIKRGWKSWGKMYA